MNDSIINPNLFRQFLKTREDAIEFQLVLSQLSEELFKTENLPEEVIIRGASYEKALTIKKIAEEYKINLQDKKMLDEFLSKLHNAVNALPLIHLTFAILPKMNLITMIQDWFYRNFHKTVLLDIEIDPSIIGGSIIRFDGKLTDHSLKKEVIQIIEGETQ